VRGIAVGGAVGFINPWGAHTAGAAAGAGLSSALGQITGNLFMGNSLFCNFNPGAVAGAAFGGGLGHATNVVGGGAGAVSRYLISRRVSEQAAARAAHVAEGIIDGVTVAGTETVGAWIWNVFGLPKPK
jgi:hypothetical protein